MRAQLWAAAVTAAWTSARARDAGLPLPARYIARYRKRFGDTGLEGLAPR